MSDSPDTATDEQDDCSHYHDRETERKWASADALHRGALATHALSAASQVLHFGAMAELDPTLVADQVKAVGDELLDWLLEHNLPPSELRDRLDEELPALENPHPDVSPGVLLANALGGRGGPASVDEADDSASVPGGVYL